MNQSLSVNIIGSGKPLVLLHGWGWHSGIWQPLVPSLLQKFQLFMIDLPGCGESADLLDAYTIENVAAAILKVAPANARWLGWSLGGMIAWYIAIHHPERVSHLITVASSPRFLRAEKWPGVDLALLQQFSQQLKQDPHKIMMEFLELQLRGSPNYLELFDELKQIFSQAKNSTQALEGGLQLLQDLDLREDMYDLQCPSLHIFGTHDTLVPVKVANLLATQLPNAACGIIKRSGHLPFLSQMANFVGLLESVR